MMVIVDRKKIVKYFIALIDMFTIAALVLQIQSTIIMICYYSKSGISLLNIKYIGYFCVSYDNYGLVGAITRGAGLIESYGYFDWNPDIYYHIAEAVNGTIIETIARRLRLILFLVNFWVIYRKKKNKDNLIKYPKTVLINIAFVVTKVILYYWYFYTAMGV